MTRSYDHIHRSPRIRLVACLTVLFVWLGLSLSSTHGQTQLQMNDDAADHLQAADKKLNATYNKIIQRNQKNKVFIAKLRAAETAWIAFRDAYLKSIFPAGGNDVYGSSYRMCYMSQEQVATNTRIEQLDKYLSSISSFADAEDRSKKEEGHLSSDYDKVLKIYPRQYLDVLRQSQSKFIAFRDKDSDAFAALENPSQSRLRRFHQLAELNNQRSKDLHQWVEGTDQGNICGGCIPRKSE